MRRTKITPRDNWEKKVEEIGLIYHHTQGRPYWNESAFYEFSAKEIDILERATNELHSMCLEAAQHVIDRTRFGALRIPDPAIPMIKKAWEAEPPSIYGRFDLAYDGVSPPKLLEYNADTPTALLEASVAQWYWLQELFPERDQFNSIHERLIEKWRELKPYLKEPLYFAYLEDSENVENTEDMMTVSYLLDTAHQAGVNTSMLPIEEIGWDHEMRCFADLGGKRIRSIFKLYPWEWILRDEFGEHVLSTYRETIWMEPIWKMILSNKGILPILWELFPGHPNLLESHLDESRGLTEHIRKPLLSREGSNIRMRSSATVLETEGPYGEEGYIYQALAKMPNFDGAYPVIGSWVIDGEAAGIGIRESDGLITNNLSCFVPHLFS